VIWVYVGAAVALGCAVAWWLGRRSYRRDDDAVQRTINPWWIPAVAGLGTFVASPFFAERPPAVVGTYLVAWVWAISLMFIDLEVRRLPDVLVLPAYPAAALLLALCSAVTRDWEALLRAAASAGVAVAVFLVAALVSPGAEGLGLGDVKLAGVLGALLGWLGGTYAVLGLLSGFVLGGLAAVFLLVFRRVNRRSSISFGPAMILGAYVWCVLGAAG
jgi:leader peptidase (prepilin peptidase)/N-methyltransferase